MEVPIHPSIQDIDMEVPLHPCIQDIDMEVTLIPWIQDIEMEVPIPVWIQYIDMEVPSPSMESGHSYGGPLSIHVFRTRIWRSPSIHGFRI